jgi:flagellin-like protein
MDPRRATRAISPVIATLLLVGMTFVLSALVYLLVIAAPPSGIDPSRFQYIHIMEIRHAGDTYSPNCDDSCIRLIHEGNAPLGNNDLAAVILRNGVELPANITTLNANLFLRTKHNGVDHVFGPGADGPKGSAWNPGEEVYIDLNDRTVKAGDFVTVRIIDKTSGLVISEDTARA